MTYRVLKWACCIKVLFVLASISFAISVVNIASQTLTCNSDAQGGFYNDDCYYKTQNSLILGWVMTCVDILVGYP